VTILASLAAPLIGLGAALIVAMIGFFAYRAGLAGRTRVIEAKRFEEYDFYPFVIDENRRVEFSPERFNEAVQHFLHHPNPRAARELIVIGEQNFVRDRFGSQDINSYKQLYTEYDGDSVISDNEAFLENYKRIVHLMGRSFPHTGIEILLHNLVNPSRSVVAIENGEVTGRKLEMGTTNLVLDLKTRRYQHQDKLNYELNLGSRQFKCTTIPIFRPDLGLVGAICINIDTRFLREEVRHHPEKLDAFFDNLLKTDFQLEENILSPDEYQSALRGKRHFLDEAIRTGIDAVETSQLAAIMFSDLVDYTSMMARDEARALRALHASAQIHRELVAKHGGRLLKELGDGFLSSFDSASRAVECAIDLQNAADGTGEFRLRIGIHLGEVTISGGDAFGSGVNIAARIQGAAAPAQVLVSDTVFNTIRNKANIRVVDLGSANLKHVDEPIRLYEILREQ
jgi:class 3 adenylate cyclase